jgi:hypothetical protein
MPLVPVPVPALMPIREPSLAGRWGVAAVDERLLTTLAARLTVRSDRSQAWRPAADRV